MLFLISVIEVAGLPGQIISHDGGVLGQLIVLDEFLHFFPAEFHRRAGSERKIHFQSEPFAEEQEVEQVLRPERRDNYYEAFDIVPLKYRPLMQVGKVLVTNWHRFAPESEHAENGKSYAVVNKGPETPDTFARRVWKTSTTGCPSW